MKLSWTTVIGAGMGLALCTGLAAGASTMVLGESQGASCYQAVKFKRTDAEALAVCTQALDDGLLTQKDRAATFVNRGIIYSQRGRYSEAFADFDEALRFNPHLGEAFANRGGTLLRMGQYDRAIVELDKALRFKLEEPSRVYFNRAIAHEELHNMRAAYRDYRKAAELMPTWEMPKMELMRFHIRAQ